MVIVNSSIHILTRRFAEAYTGLDEIHFPYHSPGNNQGDGIGMAELLGWASVKHPSVADVVRELTKRRPSRAAWTKIHEFCELGVSRSARVSDQLL
jgi:hypothetical protein